MAQAGTRPEYVVVLPAANKRGLSARRCAVIRGVRWGGLPMIREKIEETHHSYCNTVIAVLYDFGLLTCLCSDSSVSSNLKTCLAKLVLRAQDQVTQSWDSACGLITPYDKAKDHNTRG